MPQLRALVSWSLLFCFPLAMTATDKAELAGAIMHAHGNVQLNGASTPELPWPYFRAMPCRLRRTPSQTSSRKALRSWSCPVPGREVSRAKPLDLDHGDVVVSTSKGLALKADEVTIAPAMGEQAKFEVAENQDTVVIAARKGDLTVTDDQGTSTVQEGEQTTKNRRKKAGGAVPAASGAPIVGQDGCYFGGGGGGGRG